jgi:hypothetical protein
MSTNEQEIIEALQGLDPNHWSEVRDFILFLRQRAAKERGREHTRQMTASDLLESGLMGLWEHREDIGNSLEFARKLRNEAEHRSVSQE